METQKLKMSDILTAVREKTLEMDIPSTLVAVTSSAEDDGAQFAISSIVPRNDADIAKRWCSQAFLGLLNSCFVNNPRAWADIAYWKTVQLETEQKRETAEEIERILAELEKTKTKGEQE